MREGCRVTPLIEAAEMYPQLERLVLDARKRVWLAFRVFDPDTALRSDEAKALGLADWTALLRHAIGRGIEIRLLLTDFEPVMADQLHAASWRSFHRLREMSAALDEEVRNRLEIIVIQHEGEIGWGWRQILRLPLRFRARALVARLLADGDGEDGGLLSRPGLWRYLAWDGDKPSRWRASPPPRLWPATYHQKFVVVDGERAVIGGLDLDERRWDDRRHHQPADETWHDVSSLLQGPAVADAAAHFTQLWNAELPRFREIVAEWTDGAARRLTLEPLEPATAPQLPQALPDGPAKVQIVRTRSRKGQGPFAFGPRPFIREIRSAHRSLILSAERLLYIEAQFFRSRAARRWVEEALRRNPALEVIILVANAPEEVAFEGEGNNPAHRHGEWLQARALAKLQRRGGRRVGLFTLAKREPIGPKDAEFVANRGTAWGSGLIHIHAKLLIADDATCLLSSANINGRSFAWDTELGLLWRQEDGAIARFREGLWRQLFAGEPPADLAGWRAVADANKDAAPEARRGFVVPYQLRRARRFGKPYWFVPDDLV